MPKTRKNAAKSSDKVINEEEIVSSELKTPKGQNSDKKKSSVPVTWHGQKINLTEPNFNVTGKFSTARSLFQSDEETEKVTSSSSKASSNSKARKIITADDKFKMKNFVDLDEPVNHDIVSEQFEQDRVVYVKKPKRKKSRTVYVEYDSESSQEVKVGGVQVIFLKEKTKRVC